MHPAMQRRRHRLMIRRTTQRRNPRRGLVTLIAVLVGLFVLFIASTAVGTGAGLLAAYNYFATGLPDPRLLDGIAMPATTNVYDRTGTVLLARFECENREEVSFASLPDSIVDATIAAEDRTFWTNDGIDYSAVARAALINLQAGEIVQGASTITQQVIKYAGSIKEAQDALEPPPSAGPIDLDPAAEPESADPCEQPALTFLEGRGFEDKIREQILARQVTAAYPGRAGKEQILETYLNLIYYGNRSYGIKAAAANFFGTSNLDDLSLAQAAFLSGLPQLPSYYDPYQPTDQPRGPDRAMARRNDVLDAMLREGYITQREHRTAVATTWEEMGPGQVTSFLREPHFSFRVQREMERILAGMGVPNPKQAVLTGGYRVTTTLDYALQQVAKEQVVRWVTHPQLADKNVHNGALVAINSANGEIVAYVGSVDYYNREDPRVQGQFDVAGLGFRQPGSAFKPITYSSAFRARQATPATFFVDAVTQFGSNLETAYIPTNANIKEHGPLLAFDALRYSLNVPSVMMQYLVGVDVTAQFAESMGVASAEYILEQDPGLTLTLGSVPLNLTNMTQAYGVFGEGGALHPATTVIEVRDRDGKVIYNAVDVSQQTVTQPMTAAEAYLTHWILEGNTNPKTNTLWGSRAALFDVAGVRRHAGFKTGTTNDYRDVSGFGYVPGSLVTGVWMGNNNQEPLSNELGVGLFSADGPLYLWHDFMELALNQPWDWNGRTPVPNTDIPQPEGVVEAEVCRFSGMAATGGCGPTITIPFLEGTVPPPDNVHVNKGGGGGPVSTPDASGNGGGTPVRGTCFDIVGELQQLGRPPEMIAAARRWADRFVNGQLGPKGDPNKIGELGPDRVWLLIGVLRGNSGFGAPICGQIRATPTPLPSASASAAASVAGRPPGFCPPGRPKKCSPVPTPGGATAAAGLPSGDWGGTTVALFAVPAVLGGVPLAGRAVRSAMRSRRRRAPPS